MKCPKCNTEMTKGAVSIPGKVDVMWYSRESVLKSILGHQLIAWRCNTCGKVELVTEEKSN